jgi:hypothetical protein
MSLSVTCPARVLDPGETAIVCGLGVQPTPGTAVIGPMLTLIVGFAPSALIA